MEIVNHGCHHETGEANNTHLCVGSGTRRFWSRVSSASCDGSFSLLKHGGYTPLQLLYGHEPAPIEGEAFDDEQQSRSITVSMAERLARQQSAMKRGCKLKPNLASNEHRTDVHVSGSLELVFATGEQTFRVWVLCPRFDRDLPQF